jgi:hypothetical protein
MGRFEMTKKQQKEYLITQIGLAISNQEGSYKITEEGNYVFTLPGLNTKFTIRCAIDPNEYKNQRLKEFEAKIQKSRAFTNVKGSPIL